MKLNLVCINVYNIILNPSFVLLLLRKQFRCNGIKISIDFIIYDEKSWSFYLTSGILTKVKWLASYMNEVVLFLFSFFLSFFFFFLSFFIGT